MKKETIEERKPVWIALSEFYLVDIELQDSDFLRIAFSIIKSPYTLDRVKKINKYELFPVLRSNLYSVTGEWLEFDQKWLIDSIIASLTKRNVIRQIGIESLFPIFNRIQKNYWERLEGAYYELKQGE
ncbi:hypothetical protein FUAX_41950 (plasmid) [Fulvitalea axinellae]|uniref:DUF7079 domain-containing protein n=1 Tax=Fulvitalea axinellae TaxID=1182444 RepID=A0AAU9CUN5_9BACT|nr:hypothetical protein FUAX_41950 [Fulvitalea axinellae]